MRKYINIKIRNINNKNKNNIIFFDNIKPLDKLIYYIFNKISFIKIIFNFKSDETFIIFIFTLIFYYIYVKYNRSLETIPLIIFLLYLINIIDDLYYYKVYELKKKEELIDKYNLLLYRIFIYNILFLLYNRGKIYNMISNYNESNSLILYYIILHFIVLIIIYYNISLNN